MGCCVSNEQDKQAARQAVEAAQMRDLQRRTRQDIQQQPTTTSKTTVASSCVVGDDDASPNGSSSPVALQRQSKSTAVYHHEHNLYIEQDVVVEDEDSFDFAVSGAGAAASNNGQNRSSSSSNPQQQSSSLPNKQQYTVVGNLTKTDPMNSLHSGNVAGGGLGSRTTSSFSVAHSTASAGGNPIQMSRNGNGGTHNVGQPSYGSSFYTMPFSRTASNTGTVHSTSYASTSSGNPNSSFGVPLLKPSTTTVQTSTSYGGISSSMHRQSIPDGGEEEQQPWRGGRQFQQMSVPLGNTNVVQNPLSY